MKKLLKELFPSLWNQISTPVPPENAVCEFECRELECSQEEWEHCERRLKYVNLVNSVEWHNPEEKGIHT
ncbi:MAG: hypothetical protein AAGM36_01070 [Cyanobacteria bacterium J06597_1]